VTVLGTHTSRPSSLPHRRVAPFQGDLIRVFGEILLALAFLAKFCWPEWNAVCAASLLLGDFSGGFLGSQAQGARLSLIASCPFRRHSLPRRWSGAQCLLIAIVHNCSPYGDADPSACAFPRKWRENRCLPH
jgi:hypothetical protein